MSIINIMLDYDENENIAGAIITRGDTASARPEAAWEIPWATTFHVAIGAPDPTAPWRAVAVTRRTAEEFLRRWGFWD